MKDSITLIKTLDLQYIADRMVDKYDWEPDYAKESVRRYKNFLIFKCVYPKLVFPLLPEIDEIWHQHILFTENYIRDCEQIFDSYLHHKPGSTMEEAQYQESTRVYEEYFQEPFSPSLFDFRRM